MARRRNQKNVWLDLEFIDVLRDIKRQKSVMEKKDFSDADISRLIISTTAFNDVKKELLKMDNNIIAQIKVKMDRRLQ